MKRTMLVTSTHLQQFASVLTGAGLIEGMDHEGTIVFSLEGDDEFELGRLAGDIQAELRCYDTSAEIVSGRVR